MSLNNYLKEPRKAGHAIGHFNFATADVLRAIVGGAKEAGAPAVGGYVRRRGGVPRHGRSRGACGRDAQRV